MEQILGGEWRDHAGSRYFVVESRREPSSIHGRDEVGALSDLFRNGCDDASLLSGCRVRAPFLFFDLETTGLNGGAGTHAFLVGCGWFDEGGGFVTKQFMLVRLADERTLLSTFATELARAGALVSFNGRSFDAPVLETRYLYHRLPWAGAFVPHVDMLHIARRFWKRETSGPVALRQESGCSLVALEQQQLGHQRRGDVPGFEIPQRYFHFVRSGDARPLAAVFEHNRLDLLSLAALTARAVHLVGRGPGGARTAREALALGGTYARAGLGARATDAYEHAVALSATASGSLPIHLEALRALALTLRRARRYDLAAGCWQRMLNLPGCPRALTHEASLALAIHHEHRARDLAAAERFARQSLEHGAAVRVNQEGAYRLERIQRKIEQSHVSSLEFSDIRGSRPHA